MLDEPEAGIDLWSFEDLVKVFEKLHEKTVIIVSHQQRILETADKVILFENDKPVSIGRGEEMFKTDAEAVALLAQRKGELSMDKMDRTDEQLLETIADLHGIPEGSFNIRKNGKLLARNSGTDVEIVSKTDKDGIDIIVKPGVKNKSVHIPVLLTVGDFQDTVYNDFLSGKTPT